MGGRRVGLGHLARRIRKTAPKLCESKYSRTRLLQQAVNPCQTETSGTLQMASGKTIRRSHTAIARGCGTLASDQEHEHEPARRHCYVPTLAALSGGISPG